MNDFEESVLKMLSHNQTLLMLILKKLYGWSDDEMCEINTQVWETTNKEFNKTVEKIKNSID